MKKYFKIKLIYFLIPPQKLWNICGDIAERFYDKDDGAWDDLQEKFYYWISSRIKE